MFVNDVSIGNDIQLIKNGGLEFVNHTCII